MSSYFSLSRHSFLICSALVIAAATGLAGCNGTAPAQGAPAAPPPAGVDILTLEEKPIERGSDFIATLRSQRSTTVQPEVEGLITRIFVKAGDRVKAGQPLIQINADRQVAAVRSTEASRAGAEADVLYWQQQVKRLESLVEAGAISKQEFEQAQTTYRTAEAKLKALDAQLAEGKVQLQYYRVDAPQSGTVGEIPVRVGDRVTNSTELTTIDQNDQGLEVYIQLPLDRSPDLRLGLPVQIIDSEGKVLETTKISFISPRVDEKTQTVLVKSPITDAPGTIRVQQFVRTRIIWASTPGLTVPITAVTRISGQYFAFIAEPQEGGGLVARQKPIEVGEVLGNDYVLRSGLKPGDRLIVSGIQKIGDGAPVRAQ
jgi:RND family efflux transporter MFP subunit